MSIKGTPTQGETLTITNTLADADGLGAISYQWKADGNAIAGGTSSSLVLTEAEVGKAIAVTASYTDGHGSAESTTSAATEAVANVNDAPTGAVSIEGTPTQGETLTARNTLADADGLGAIAYQWQADGTNINGAAGDSLVLTEAEVGKAIAVTASYTDGHGSAESTTSAATEAVANVNDAPSGAVSIEGTPTQGETLTAWNTLADADGLGAIAYQWQADGTNINGATGDSFVLTEAQAGKEVSVIANYTDGHGSAESVVSDSLLVSAVPTGKSVEILAYSWKAHTLMEGVNITSEAAAAQTTGADGCAGFAGVTETSLVLRVERIVPAHESALTDQAVNLQDAIAILKMIVGLDVNGAGRALSPYQAFAADYDDNGQVQLIDAIGVLKHVVGLAAPAPDWHFANEDDAAVPQVAALSPGAAPAIGVDLSAAAKSVHVGLVGYVSGDVDGSFDGDIDSQDLDDTQSDYFSVLIQDHQLDPAQFGVYL